MATIPKDLAIAATERKLLLFIGAGFTRNIDKSLPTWSNIIDEMANILGYDPDILKLQGDYLQLAEYLNLCGLKDKLIVQLAKSVDDETKYSISKSQPHLLLPHLDVRSIYTTNWDNWIERGFDHEKVPYQKIAMPRDFSEVKLTSKTSFPIVLQTSIQSCNTSPRHYAVPYIVKFHGDFNHPDSIVINETGYYKRLDFNHPLDLRFRSDIIGCSVLFIGYSFSDPNVRYIWYKLGQSMKDSGVIVKSYFVTHQNNPVQEKIFLNANIEQVLLDPIDIKKSLVDVLKSLIQCQQ